MMIATRFVSFASVLMVLMFLFYVVYGSSCLTFCLMYKRVYVFVFVCMCVWIHIGLHLGMSFVCLFALHYNSFYYFNSSVELQGPSKPPHVLSLTDLWLRIGENSCVSSTDGSRSSIEFGVIGLGVVRIGLFIGQDITSPMMMFGLIFCSCCCSWSRLRCFFISCRSSFWWISCSNRRML
uniref:(northern house mosquito) hypothetical protein n=1 Tax=Culex pipiens TaxID=7175 RepID=A0A8D8MKJ5_CULPI